MIDMNKKYRTRDGRDVRLCADNGPKHKPILGVVIFFDGSENAYSWYVSGRQEMGNHDSWCDLIEVVPDVVMYEGLQANGDGSAAFSSIAPLQNVLRGCDNPKDFIAITKTTIRNGGQSHADVTVEVLPVDYKETP